VRPHLGHSSRDSGGGAKGLGIEGARFLGLALEASRVLALVKARHLRRATVTRSSSAGSGAFRDKPGYRNEAPLIDPHARRALDGVNQGLLLDTGEVTGTSVRPQAAGGTEAEWTMAWPLQQAARIAPVTLRAHYGTAFHQPHLRSGTTGDWPLNVFDDAQEAAELPTLRATAAADLHNLVFQLGGDVRIIPAGGRTAGTREKFLLAERWIRGESLVYESRHGRSRPPGQRSRG
jgi:hypothetical protein